MSDLQLALLVLGAIIIFAVVAFNWWQERKLRKEAAEHFNAPSGDVLMDDEFQFDAEAILKEDSPELARMEPGKIDDPSFNEDRLAAEETFQEVIKHDSLHEDTSEAAPVQESAVSEFNTVWNELEPDTTVPDVEDESSLAKSYEEHSWLSAAENPVEEEVATQAELIREAGFDEPPDDQEATAESLVTSAGPAADSIALSPDIDPRVDLIAVLYLPHAVTGDQLRDFLISATDIDKPKYLHGLDIDGVWRLLTREQESMSFTKATCAVQLADRSGFISRNALDRFQHEVDRLGHKLNAQIEWQSQGDPWQQASELDQFCIDVDKMVGFHLVQGDNGPFTGTKFRGLAEANGLVLGTDGGFHSENEPGHRLFSAVNRDNHPFSPEMLRTSVIHGVTFQLDIPRVRNCPEVFNQMVLTARQMENSLGARLVDDNQRPLGETQIEKIRQQLKVIHAKMVARGIIPGSPSALRLFS
ncbi:MAG: cell division protein FtsZ [Betaproteobacteria bacterium HGW-Betaproteobacteria-8]|nr:MAG: cell division protein FtsZ [Betaproteobacteria bacterium HGW-Betaproteobacteria-8]